MDLALSYIKINRYILSQVREKSQSVEEDFIARFKPFYKWRIGNLTETEIKEALVYFIINSELPQNLSNASMIPFSILVECYKRVVEKIKKSKPSVVIESPEKLTKDDWLEIRSLYKKEIGSQYDGAMHNISFNESFNYGKKEEELDRPKSLTGNHESGVVESSDLDDLNTISILQEELEEFLNNIELGVWKTMILDSEYDKYRFHAAMVNLHIDNEGFQKTIQLLIENYPDWVFSLKEKKTNKYIEAFIRQS